MHYFPSWTQEFILNMSWNNFTLYMASIPSVDDEEEKEVKKDIPTVSAGELF